MTTFERDVREQWPEQADTVLGLIRGQIDPDTFSSVQNWTRQCYHAPSAHDRIACALNEVLEMHGTEGLEVNGDFVGDYLNAGDTYATTLIYSNGTYGRRGWSVGTWGDFIERYDVTE